MTIRQLIDKIGDEYMDAELTIQIIGSNNESAQSCYFSEWPSRRPACVQTGEPAYMVLTAYDRNIRVLKAKK